MIIIFSIAIFIISILSFWWLEKLAISRAKRNIIAIFVGGFAGFLIQTLFKENGVFLSELYGMLGVLYIRFLQMLTFPVVSVAILLAFLHIGEVKTVSKSPIYIIGILLFTTAIAAFVGYISVVIFKLDITQLSGILANEQIIQNLTQRQSVLNQSFYKTITDFIPTNPFMDLAGLRPISLASTVIFFSIIGFAYLVFKKTNTEDAIKVKSFIEISYKIIMIVVGFALKLTPYGVLGLFAKMSATLDFIAISKLFSFVLVSYFAIFVMFVIHGIIITFTGINPITYYKKTFELLSFGFFSRSSSASIPLNIETQVKKFGISNENATVSASFGSIIGQNGCAGIYPAMLVSMVASGMGTDILTFQFIALLILIVTINSFGIAGVGGGAIFAAIASLSAFGMPLTIVALLAGIEPVVDMARTALNINGSVTASIVSQKITSKLKD